MTNPLPVARKAPPGCYLAGPGVFRYDHAEFAERLKLTCSHYGLQGLFPLDADVPPAETRERHAADIRRANLDLITRSAVVIAEMTPFRGPGMDGGTAYEMGVAAAREIPVFGWNPVPGEYKDRVRDFGLEDAMTVEDFGLSENLMMTCGLTDGVVHPTFEDACRAAAEHLGVWPHQPGFAQLGHAPSVTA